MLSIYVSFARRNLLFVQIRFSRGLWKFFYGVTEHSSGHLEGVKIEEGKEKLFIDSLSDFAEHSSDSFVDEVVGVVQEKFGELEGVRMLTLFDEVEGGDDGDPSFSEGGRSGELVEFGAVLVEVVATDDFRGSEVDEISIIDEGGIAEVEVYNLMITPSPLRGTPPNRGENYLYLFN